MKKIYCHHVCERTNTENKSNGILILSAKTSQWEFICFCYRNYFFFLVFSLRISYTNSVIVCLHYWNWRRTYEKHVYCHISTYFRLIKLLILTSERLRHKLIQNGSDLISLKFNRFTEINNVISLAILLSPSLSLSCGRIQIILFRILLLYFSQFKNNQINNKRRSKMWW